jgi:hypothetical protein
MEVVGEVDDGAGDRGAGCARRCERVETDADSYRRAVAALSARHHSSARRSPSSSDTVGPRGSDQRGNRRTQLAQLRRASDLRAAPLDRGHDMQLAVRDVILEAYAEAEAATE